MFVQWPTLAIIAHTITQECIAGYIEIYRNLQSVSKWNEMNIRDSKCNLIGRPPERYTKYEVAQWTTMCYNVSIQWISLESWRTLLQMHTLNCRNSALAWDLQRTVLYNVQCTSKPESMNDCVRNWDSQLRTTLGKYEHLILSHSLREVTKRSLAALNRMYHLPDWHLVEHASLPCKFVNLLLTQMSFTVKVLLECAFFTACRHRNVSLKCFLMECAHMKSLHALCNSL